MAALVLLSRDVTCMLCGKVTARLIRPAASPEARPRLVPEPGLPDGPCTVRGRLACAFCGGSLYLDSAEHQLVDTRRVYPPERRGRPPGRSSRPPGEVTG